MKQIFNWTIGSFFRSFGRILCYIVVGGIIALLLYSNDSVRDFRITDLFGIETVSASTFTSIWVPTYSDEARTTLSTSKTLTSNINTSFTSTKFYFTRGYFLHNWGGTNFTGGQLIIPFNLTTPIFSANTTSTITHQSYCDRWEWQSIDSYNNVIKWKCANYNFGVDDDHITDREYIYPTTSIKAVLHTFLNGVAYEELCQVKDNSFYCPIGFSQDELDYIEIFTNVNYGSTTNTKDYDLSIDYFVNVEFDGTTNAINSLTQQQQATTNSVNSINQTISDTNTNSDVSSASHYFNDFNETAQDGIKAIVSMPLNIFNALTLGSTKDLCFNLRGKQSCFPSGAMLWNKSSRTSIHAGNATWIPHPFSNGGGLSEQLTLFKSLFNIVVGGYLGYKMLKSLMRITNDMLSPTHDKVEVLDL